MSTLEATAIELHDLIWSNLGTTDDWPLQVCGDDEIADEFSRLMNKLQREIKTSGYPHMEYCPKLP